MTTGPPRLRSRRSRTAPRAAGATIRLAIRPPAHLQERRQCPVVLHGWSRGDAHACVIIGPGCSDSPSGLSASNPALTRDHHFGPLHDHSAPGDTVDTAGRTRITSGSRPRCNCSLRRGSITTAPANAAPARLSPGVTRTALRTRARPAHTIGRRDNHEGVHTVVILQIGHPPPLFTEGIAVAHQTNPPQGILRPR